MEVIRIEISSTFLGQEYLLNPCVLRQKNDTFLIDCGYEGSIKQLSGELGKYGIQLAELTGIIISHEDIDHMGALHEIKEEIPSIKIYSSEIEAPYLSGEKKSLRLLQAESLRSTMPEQFKEWATAFEYSLRTIKRVPVDFTFGFDFHFSDQIRIVNTPGHTPGHISIYLPEEKILLANDALVVENGELEIANPHFSLDLAQALDSVKKLARLEIDKVICYHGGEITKNIPGQLKKLIEKYS